jgi:hypothetical protein
MPRRASVVPSHLALEEPGILLLGLELDVLKDHLRDYLVISLGYLTTREERTFTTHRLKTAGDPNRNSSQRLYFRRT